MVSDGQKAFPPNQGRQVSVAELPPTKISDVLTSPRTMGRGQTKCANYGSLLGQLPHSYFTARSAFSHINLPYV